MKSKLLTLDYKFISVIDVAYDFNNIDINFIGIVENAFGRRCWIYRNKLHNLKGHAVEWNGGDYEYYINGVKYTEDAHRLLRRMMELKKLI